MLCSSLVRAAKSSTVKRSGSCLPNRSTCYNIYAIQTIPSNQSFDAKRELKRVLRGENLPADHPEKPKTWLEQTLSRVGATVAAEVAMGLGYEVSLTNVVGVAKVAYVRLPMAKMNCYWLGVFGKWYYVTTVRDREEDNQQAR
jgi:hypothetical protein